MSAVLTLIFIFSIAIFFTNQRVFRDLRVFSLSGLLLLVGLCFSDSGPIPLLHSTQAAISNAMRVALVFVSFFFGIRHGRNPLALFLFTVPLIALALIPDLQMIGLDRLLLAALPGVAVALASRLILDTRSQLSTPAKLAFGGVCTLAAGWSWGIGTPEILTGYTFGLVSGFLFPSEIFQDRELTAAKMSFSMAIVFFAGTYFTFSNMAIVAGLGLSFLYLITQVTFKSELVIQWRSWTLPLSLSLLITSHASDASQLVLSSAIVGYLVTELILAGVRVARSTREAAT